MGISYNLKCDQCDYQVTSVMKMANGWNATFVASVCTHCNELVDVPIINLSGSPAFESTLDKCPQCHSGDALEMWDEEKAPCPKCKGTLVKHGYGFFD